MGETIDGELLQTNKNNSIAIQTDDTGCSNRCTSMYVENGSVLQQSNLEREIPGGSEESSVSGDTNVFMDDVNAKESTSGSIDNTETEIEAEINYTDEDRTDQTNAICKPSKCNLRARSSVSHPLPDETFEVPSGQDDCPAKVIAKKYHCSHCNKAFRCLSACTVHERIHSGEKPYKCKHCSKTFTQSSSCISHERIHSGEKPYKCKHCSKTFTDSSSCIRHERVHSGEKPYKCKHCSKTFTDSSSCIRHERVLSGEKPFKCKHCSKTFTQSSNCRTHERIHSREKPYKCKHCSKTFTRRSSCIRHERIHAVEKPYKCKHCSKTFTDSSNCRNHERIHSGEKGYKCMQLGLPTPWKLFASEFQ